MFRMEHVPLKRQRRPYKRGPDCPCGRAPRRSGQRTCGECHKEYMRKNRPKHSELSEEQRKKANARSYANCYKRRGLLKQEPCKTCGDENSQMHHDDYDKPLEVIWFCRKCHLDHHKNNSIPV